MPSRCRAALDAFLGDPGGVQAVAVDSSGVEPARPHAHERLHERRDQDLGAAVRLAVRRVVHQSSVGASVDRAPQRRVAPVPGSGARSRRASRRRAARPAAVSGGGLQHCGTSAASARSALAVRRSPSASRSVGNDDLVRCRRSSRCSATPLRLEHRQQGHEVGERLVEGQLVGQAGLGVAGSQPVEDRVADLVRDDVVGRGRCRARAARRWPAASRRGRRCARGSRTRWPPRVRWGTRYRCGQPELPRDRAAEVLLEQRERVRRDREHVLRPELRGPRRATAGSGSRGSASQRSR